MLEGIRNLSAYGPLDRLCKQMAALALGMAMALSAPAVAAENADPLVIVGFGDSLMAGYRLAPDESFPAQFASARTQAGHAAVVRNWCHRARPFQTGISPVSVRMPKLCSKMGQLITFPSAVLLPYVQRTKI